MPVSRTPILRKFHNYTGDVITQGSVTIVTASTGSVPVGSTATIYSAETGSGTLSQPLSLQTDGGVSGWLEIGIYNMTAATSFGTVTSRYYVNHPEQSVLQGTATVDDQFQINDDGDTYSRISINAGGTVRFGSGASATDVNLYRSGVGTIATDNAFSAGTLNAASGTFSGALKAASGTFTNNINATNGTFSYGIYAQTGTVNSLTNALLYTSNGSAGGPSYTFTSNLNVGLWYETASQMLTTSAMVSSRNIERGTAVPTVTSTSTLGPGPVVGKSINTGGLIILNPGATQTFTLPSAALIYAEFGYVGAIFSFTLTNISANACTIATNTGITEYTNLLGFPYSLAAGVSLTMKYYVASSTTGYIIAATI